MNNNNILLNNDYINIIEEIINRMYNKSELVCCLLIGMSSLG